MSSQNGRNGGAVADAPVISRRKSGSVAATGGRPAAGRAGTISAEKAFELEATVAAIGRSQAVIEFQMDGTILTANETFLKTLGYSLEEIQGRHHRMFVEPAEQNSAAYAEFWVKLNRGDYQAGEYKRIGKGGKEVWIQASYNPIFDLNGKPFKVVKFATDVSRQVHARLEMEELFRGLGASNRRRWLWRLRPKS